MSTPTRARPQAGGRGRSSSAASSASVSAQRFAARRRVMVRRRLLRVAVVVAVLAVVGGIAWAVLASSWLALRTVEVQGNERATSGLVELTADLPVGTPLARLDLDAARARVEALPVVAHASVVRVWPHTVRVVVTERTPRAVAAAGTGWRLVDAEGVAFAGTMRRPPGLPLLELDLDTADPDTVRAAMAVVAGLPPRLATSVRSVRAGSADDVRLVLDSGSLVRWGSAQDGALKAQVLAALLTRPARGYDVSAPDAPTTRR